MSGGDDNDPQDGDDGIEFDLDDIGWDDALAELEDELDEAEDQQAHLSEARPLYRPPSPNDQFARRPPPPKPPAPIAPNIDDLPSFADIDDEDESFASTKIAQIPQELINSLVSDEHKRPTRPPPMPNARAGAELPKDGPPSVDLDLDDLLDGYEDETVVYPEGQSRAPLPSRAEKRPFGARPVTGKGPKIISKPPPAPSGEEDGLVTSYAPGRISAPPPDFDDDEDEMTRVVSSPYSSSETKLDDDPLAASSGSTALGDDPLAGFDAPGFDDAPEPATRVAASPLLEAERARLKAKFPSVAAVDAEISGSEVTATHDDPSRPTPAAAPDEVAQARSDAGAPMVEEPTRVLDAPSLAQLRAEEGAEDDEDDDFDAAGTRVLTAPSELIDDDDDDFDAAGTRVLTAPSELIDDDDEDDDFDSAGTRVLTAPSELIDDDEAEGDDDFDSAGTRVAVAPSEQAEAKAPAAPSIPKPPKPSIPRPSIPKPGGAPGATRPKLPPIPKPGARPAIPRPNLGIPKPGRPGAPGRPVPPPPGRPSLKKPSLPKPGLPKPGLPKPGLPGLPKPGLAKPGLASGEPAAADAPPPAEPPTPQPTPIAADSKPKPSQAERLRPREQPSEGVDSDLDALLSADRARASAPPEPAPASDEVTIDAAPVEADAADSDEITVEPVASDEVTIDADSSVELSVGDDADEEEEVFVIDEDEDEEQELIVADDDEDEAEAFVIEADDDDDEAVVIEAADDDSDELVIEAGGDDDDLAIVDGDDDWDDEDWEALEAAEAEADAEAARAAADDRGAVAARRTVRSRKPRDEHFPMVGDEPGALRLRLRLLKSLGESRQGAVRARLFVGAAELAEQLGDADQARELYVLALSSDPSDLVALRALRRDAVARGEWKKLATLYEREAKLELSAWEKATAWTALAELHLGRLDDPAAAERAALSALEAQPRSMAATLLLAEARWRKGEAAPAVEKFADAREIWDDPDARAVLAVEEARVAEHAGDEERARELYSWANDVDPEALDGWFGRARTSSRADADPPGAVEALATIGTYCGGPLGEAVLTRASRVATRLGKDPMLGVRLLGEATGVLPLQARADAAMTTGDAQLELTCLAAWAGAAGGTDRALALVRTAEAKAAQGDLDGAESALRDAARADGSLGTIRVVREVIARRSGDVSRLADAVEGGGALAAAARLARDKNALEREHELLLEAVAEGTALVSADVIGLDVAAGRSDVSTLQEALRRQADRVPPEQRVGSLLALVESSIEQEQLDQAETLLDEARKLSPGDPLALRPLGRLALRRSAADAAAMWLEEASGATGTRASFAATQAGHLLAASDGDALGAYRKALEASAGYRPAAWAMKPIAIELDDPLSLGESYEQLAQTAADPQDGAGHLLRGALLRADADPAGASALLARAHELAPQDMVLTSLQMRLAGEGDAKARAQILASAAGTAGERLARVYRLQSARAFEDSGEPASAAEQYLAVLETSPDDPLVIEALDRVQVDSDQVALVAERRMNAVKEASNDDERTVALERLAELDLVHRNDAASAVLSLQSILEHVPGHLPSLRTLHRYYAQQGRHDDAAAAVAAQARQLEPGADVTAYARLARRLMLRGAEATPETSDELLLDVASRADLDLWLAPRVLAAALDGGKPEHARAAAKALAALLSAAEERASARMRAAALISPVDPNGAVELLGEAVHAYPNHPLAASALAEACEQAGDLDAAAEAYERAGAASDVRARSAKLYYKAAQLWQDQVQDDSRARAALTLASESDVSYEDVFERLQVILETADDKAALADLYQHRLNAGGDDVKLVELYVKQAELRSAISDYNGAKAALRSALTLQPERVDALRGLANLCLEDEDWRGAAEVLIRIARIRKEREELRWVFFTLGDIYDQHMPDPRRAEAAFRRVLKLFPNDLPAMERLAELYHRQNQLPQAAKVLEDLAEREVDLEASRTHRLRLAQIHEQLEDARKAEQVLEAARKGDPTDLQVIRALADFYRRQKADNAMSMHLRRAVNDFRHALEADLADPSAWPGLVEVLRWNGRDDAAAAVASAAQAVGVTDIEMSKLVDARGAATGANAGAANDALDELLAPPQLGAPVRAVFKIAGDALEKSLPFDVNAYRAERVDNRDTRIRPLALEVARWFRVSPVELYVTSAAPRVCVPVQSNPCVLLIGSELMGITDDREKLFVLARAFKIAKAKLSVVVRSQPQEVVALIGGLVQSYDPHHVPTGADPAHVAEAARRVTKHVGRKAAGELGPLVFEMAGRQGYDPAKLAMAASEWGNRTALVASGSAPAALSALAKLSGERELPDDPSARVKLLQRFAEASALLSFALTDAHFDARAQSGVGQG